MLTSRIGLEWDWVSCPCSILVGGWHSHPVLYSRDSVHHLLSCTALQLVLLRYCPIWEQYHDHQGLCPLVCMLMCQRPCDLHLGACSVWYSHMWRKSRGHCMLRVGRWKGEGWYYDDTIGKQFIGILSHSWFKCTIRYTQWPESRASSLKVAQDNNSLLRY